MNFYVYKVDYCGVVGYVGSGCGDRISHVCSGSSHNKMLNEVYYRHLLFGEPMLKPEIVGSYTTKKAAMAAEKQLIKRLNPIFNQQGCQKKAFNLLTTDQKFQIKNLNSEFYNAIDIFEKVCEKSGCNPKLALTPIGVKICGQNSCSDIYDCHLIGFSMFGICEPLQVFFEWKFVGKGALKVWLKREFISLLNNGIGSSYYEFSPVQFEKGGCLSSYKEYHKNYFGSVVPSEYFSQMKDDLLLCRTLGLRNGVKVVIAVYKLPDSSYIMICENNKQIISDCDTFGEMIFQFRFSRLVGNKIEVFGGCDSLKVVDFDINGCFDFESGVTFNRNNY